MNNSVFHYIIRILSQMNSNSRNALFYWLSEPMRLFKLYCRRGLTCQVIHDPVDALDLIYDAVGNLA